MEREPQPAIPKAGGEKPTYSLQELVVAVNDGTLKAEIDAATGYDPDLAV